MRRLLLIDRDTGEILIEYPRQRQRRNNIQTPTNTDTTDLLTVLAVALVGLLLVVITE